MEELESTQETLMQLDADTAFNCMIWSLSLLGTGNTNYQNEFYERQNDKIVKRYEDIIK